MKFYLSQVETVKNSLREDFLYLTEVLLKKTIPHANKQLQDTLTKYFLENYVSDLLKDKMRKNNNRAVFQEIQATISSGRPKYLKLLNAFEDKIHFFQLDVQYNSMLLTLILDTERHPKDSEEWRTHTRKRMLSLLLYVHWNEQENRDEFQSFYDMWKVVFPDNPLPQRQFKNQKIHTFDQKSMYSSQSLDDESLYNQKQHDNNTKTNNKTENDLGGQEELHLNQNEEAIHNYPCKKIKLLSFNQYQLNPQNLGNTDPLRGSQNSQIHQILSKQQQASYVAPSQLETAVNNENLILQPTNSNISFNPTQFQGFNFSLQNHGFTGTTANISQSNINNNKQQNDQYSANDMPNNSYQIQKYNPIGEEGISRSNARQLVQNNQLNSIIFDGVNNLGASINTIFQNNPNSQSIISNNNTNSNFIVNTSNNKNIEQFQTAGCYLPSDFSGSYRQNNPNEYYSIAACNMTQPLNSQQSQIFAGVSSLESKDFISESQNFSKAQQSDKKLECKYNMDASDNNKNINFSDIFLTGSYCNPSQFNSVANNRAAVSLQQNLHSASANYLNQQNGTLHNNSSVNFTNLNNFQLPSQQISSQNGQQNTQINNNLSSIQNQMNNLQQNKLEQSQIKQQQQSPQQQQSYLMNSLSMAQQKLVQSAGNEQQLPILYHQNLNMGSSVSNLGYFPQPNSIGNSNKNHHSIFFTGSAPLGGMGCSSIPNNYIHQFFLQYYQEFKEEEQLINWESTEPLGIYGKYSKVQGDGLEDLFRSVKKKNIIVNGKNIGISGKIEESELKDNENKKEKNSNINEDIDGDAQFSGTIESYEVEENPVSQ